MLTENGYYTGLQNLGFEDLSITATAVKLAAVPIGAKVGRARVEANATTKTNGVIAIRKRGDSVSPTASVGFPLYADEVFDIRQIELGTIEFISSDGLTQKLNIEYYG